MSSSNDLKKNNLSVTSNLVANKIATNILNTAYLNTNSLSVNGETLTVSIDDINTVVSSGGGGGGGTTTTLGIEDLTFSSAKTTTLSTETTKNVSNITSYDYTQTDVGELANSTALSGYVKYITLDNGKVAPVQINTEKGAFLLYNPSCSSTQLVSTGINWKQITGSSNLVWFPYQQVGSKIQVTANIGSSRAATVAFSADGSVLAIGGIEDNSNVGATWIFELNESTNLYTQTQKLIGTANVGGSNQGSAVSLSADGNTLAVGGQKDDSSNGAVWVFTRDPVANVWSQQGSKLVGTGNTGAAQQGASVSLSADGNTLAVGGFADDTGVGAVWIFVRSGGGVWSQQGSKLVGTGLVAPSAQGVSVSLSSDGNTLAVGGSGDNTTIGAVWIYTRNTSGVWTQQGSKLVGTGSVGSPGQGVSVSLSSNGNTLAVGGFLDDTDKGAVWIYVRNPNDNSWSQQGAKLTSNPTVAFARFGGAVSLSADGNTLSIGAGSDNNIGATWIFTRQNSTTWSQQGTKLVGTGSSGATNQGTYLSITAKGDKIASGAPVDNGTVAGAVWIFN